ncbi:MAG: hypothetical protein LBR51_07855 [Bacteroidales bacterium]|jgi:hypothetical protein|nr:hypothetical protein [Bacteroidales bacterium]
MKRIKYLIGIAALLSVMFASGGCEKPLDLNGTYRDITVTYGILDPAEPVQYVKVYKGYLTTENAITVAGNYEAVLYMDSILVELTEKKNEKITRVIQLDTTTAVPKEPGTFSAPKQLLYYTKTTLDVDASYELKITNKYTRAEKQASTTIVHPFSIAAPSNVMNLTVNSIPAKFTPPENGYAYDFYQRFYYIEVSNTTGEVVKRGYVTRKLNSNPVKSTGKESEIVYRFNPSNIYATIANQLSPDPTVTRYADENTDGGCLELEIWAAEQNLATYIDVGTATSSIVNDRNFYTNFESADNSAYGIFSSRTRQNKRYGMQNTTTHNEDSLVNGSYTKNLGFDYFYKYQP